jgi:SAM-dependent methyltransferase
MSSEYQDYGFPDAKPSHMFRHFVPPIERLLKPLGKRLRILDVGCGNGALCGILRDLGHEVVGIDLSEQGIAVARKAWPELRFELLAADDELMGKLCCEPFDVVVSTEVVEHLYAPRSFIDGCWAALKPGGRLILTTPYHGYLKNLVLALAGKWDKHADPLWDGGHIKLWSRASLGALLMEKRFENVTFQGAGRLPYLWMTMVMSGDKPR